MALWKGAADSPGGPSETRKFAPPGPSAGDRVFRAINPTECFDLLEPGGIGHVSITGFDPSKDVIVLQKSLATDFSDLTIQQVSGNTVITIQGVTPDQITLVGVTSALHASDFHFVV